MNKTLSEIFFDKDEGKLIILLRGWLLELKTKNNPQADQLLDELNTLVLEGQLSKKVILMSRIFL